MHSASVLRLITKKSNIGNSITSRGCTTQPPSLMKYPGAAAYGREYPEFWVQIPIDGKPATVGNGSHVGFVANSKQAVHAFHEAAVREGGVDDGAPGPRPDYGESYYGCFIRDPDGNKIEATYWKEEL